MLPRGVPPSNKPLHRTVYSWVQFDRPCSLASYWVDFGGTGQRCCRPVNADPLDGEPLPEPREIAEVVLGEIRDSFPDLAMRMNATDEGEPELEIPAQPGLAFDVELYLYDDVLNLCAGQFWGEWFPCHDSEVVSRYVEAVSGLLAGEFRIVEFSRNGRVLKSFLQRPRGEGWENISRHYHGLSIFAFPFLGVSKRTIQNVAV